MKTTQCYCREWVTGVCKERQSWHLDSMVLSLQVVRFCKTAFFSPIFQEYNFTSNHTTAGNIMDGVNLFKVHCTHGWNYKNETPHIINVCNKINR